MNIPKEFGKTWRFLPSILAGCIGIGLAFAILVVASDRERARIKEDFAIYGQSLANPLQLRVAATLATLQSVGSFYAGSREVDREEFQEFTKYTFNSHPGIRVLAWVPRVLPGRLKSHLEEARKTFKVPAGYRIRGKDGLPLNVDDSVDSRVLYPIQFVEPLLEVQDLWGLDLALYPECTEVMEMAKVRETAVSTASQHLAGDLEQTWDGMIFLPIFANGKRHQSPEERQENLSGFALMVLRVDDLMRETLKTVDMDGMEAYIFDSAGKILYQSGPGATRAWNATHNGKDHWSHPAWRTTIEHADRSWTLICLPTNSYLIDRASWQPWTMFGVTLLFTLLLVGYLVGAAGRTARVEALVVARTSELTHINHQLHRLADEYQSLANTEQQARIMLQATVEELKKTQGQLVQSEKLAGLGQMVAGVAHEINNPLAFVINNVAILQRDFHETRTLLEMYQQSRICLATYEPGLSQQIQTYLEQIDLPYALNNLDRVLDRSRDGLKRIQKIVLDLRNFARLDESDLKEVDLNTGIESTLNIIRGRAKANSVELELDLAPLPMVACYAAKINQVVLNLVANAIDACGQEGKVVIRSRPTKDGVSIAIIDNGVGIDPAIRDKIFDPFFTTKPIGTGTGLGLSISHGIVTDHGGRMEVESTLGQGSTFTIHLPLHPVPQTRRGDKKKAAM